MSLAVILRWFRSFKMLSSARSTIHSMLATLQVVTVLVIRMDTFTQSTFSTVLLTAGHPAHLVSSTEVTWLWHSENYSELVVCVFFFFFVCCFLKATFMILKLSVAFFPIFKVKFFARMLFQVCPFLGIPKWEWSVHTCI